jgi:hypothetical protein
LRPRVVDDDEGLLKEASSELARAIWQTVLLARDDAKARGLLGQATRSKLVDQTCLDPVRAPACSASEFCIAN